MKKLVLMLLLAGTAACGTAIQIYEWQQVDVNAVSNISAETVPAGQVLPLSELAIRIELNPRQLVEVANSDWFARDAGFQSSERVSGIEIRASQQFVRGLSTDSLLNRVFLARRPEPGAEALPVDEFLQNFGRLSGQIDDAFLLVPEPGLEIASNTLSFTVLLRLARGGVLGDRTETITLE